MKKYLNNYPSALTLFVFMHVIAYAVIGFFIQGEVVHALILQGSIAALAFFGYSLRDKSPYLSKDFIAIAIALTPAVLVYIFTNHPWQIDTHMYFFATLAMVTGLKSVRALLMAATAIAVHHLSLNFIMPAFIFPEGANFVRVIFHAVVVVIETSAIWLTIYGLNKNDEQIKKEVENANAALKQAEEAESEQRRLEVESLEQKKRTMGEMADQFEKRIGGLVSEVNSASTHMQGLSDQLSKALKQMEEQGDSVSASGQNASGNVQTVASAAEELSASIQEISRNVASASNLANLCAESAQLSETKIAGLEEAVNEIDSVIQSIKEVAEQTNLLALNATIESARAGEAGKGFAVVANEVKTLASETHKMTGNISEKVDDIKNRTKETIDTIKDIIEKVRDVSNQTTSIASAIEQQNSATSEISRSVQQASQGTQEVSDNIVLIKTLVADSSASTETLKSSSENLAGLSRNLKETADGFVKDIRGS